MYIIRIGKSRIFFIFILVYMLCSDVSLGACKAHTLLQSLSLREKIGQLFIAGVPSISAPLTDNNGNSYTDPIEDLITTYKIGGIIWYGSDTPPHQQIARTQKYKEINRSNKITLWFMQDLEPNFMSRVKLSPFPTAAQLGTQSDSQVELAGTIIGTIAKIIGVDIVLAPVVDIHSNPHNPIINTRSFGTTPDQVTAQAQAFIDGLCSTGVLYCLKHFPGHGDTNTDSHTTLPCVSYNREWLNTHELYPFENLIKNNQIPVIMIGHLAVPALTGDTHLPASLSSAIVQSLLQQDMAFEGLIITDALNMHGVSLTVPPNQIALQALLAGNDILLSPSDIPASIETIEKAVENNALSVATIDAHVLKIIKYKALLR